MHDIKMDVICHLIIFLSFFPSDQNPLLQFIFQTGKTQRYIVHLAQINAIMSCNQWVGNHVKWGVKLNIIRRTVDLNWLLFSTSHHISCDFPSNKRKKRKTVAWVFGVYFHVNSCEQLASASIAVGCWLVRGHTSCLLCGYAVLGLCFYVLHDQLGWLRERWFPPPSPTRSSQALPS